MRNNPRKQRHSEDLDFLEPTNRRRCQRFQTNDLFNIPLKLSPAPPYFGRPVNGQIVDLSGGGMAIRIREIFPVGSKHRMELYFPNGSVFKCRMAIRRVATEGEGYIIGIQFEDLSDAKAAVINAMAIDYNACEQRISEQAPNVCHEACAFLELCNKPQKNFNVENPPSSVLLKLVTDE